MYNLLHKYSQQPTLIDLSFNSYSRMRWHVRHMQEIYRSYVVRTMTLAHFMNLSFSRSLSLPSFTGSLCLLRTHTNTNAYRLHIGRVLGGFDSLIDVQTSDVYAMATRDLVWFTRTRVSEYLLCGK